MSRKVLSIILSIVMILSAVSFTAFAATDSAIIFGEAAYTKTTVKVPVVLDSYAGSDIASFTMNYSYPTDKLAYAGAEAGVLPVDGSYATANKISWYGSAVVAEEDAVLFYLVFNKVAGAKGEAAVSASVVEIGDSKMKAHEATVVDGTYDVNYYVIAEGKDGIPSNFGKVRISEQVLTGGLGGADADNKYLKLTRTFKDVSATDPTLSGMDANMYLTGPNFDPTTSAKYYVLEMSIWNNDADTISVNFGTNGNAGISGGVSSSKDLNPNVWNKVVNVIDVETRTYYTYINGKFSISKQVSDALYSDTGKAIRFIISTTANLTDNQGRKLFSNIENTIYVDDIKIYETSVLPVTDGYTNTAVNNASVYAPADTAVIAANGNAADVAAAMADATGANAKVLSNYTALNGGVVNTGAIAEGDVVITEANGIYKFYNTEVVGANTVKFVEFADGCTAIANVADKAELVLASFDKNDSMVDVAYTTAVAGWNLSKVDSAAAADYTSAILVDNFDDLTPLCENAIKAN